MNDSITHSNHPANGSPVTLTLPTNIVRHEIISLQLAVSPGGAEFYPSCTKIRVGGSQSGTPNQTVSFPGAYSDANPDILDPHVHNSGSLYVFPGPVVSNLASPSDMSTSNGGQNNGNPSGTSTRSGSGAEPTESGVWPTGSSTKATCGVRKLDPSLARRQHKRLTNFIPTLRDLIRHS
jgi:hypothetical protein